MARGGALAAGPVDQSGPEPAGGLLRPRIPFDPTITEEGRDPVKDGLPPPGATDRWGGPAMQPQPRLSEGPVLAGATMPRGASASWAPLLRLPGPWPHSKRRRGGFL
mmetsp:Transcript_46395/g.131206  ORF Transcript_46395/g.131206 Transcript_46395/m.131206 type:complete len:107 (+) Transcript_46395:101-421(+)